MLFSRGNFGVTWTAENVFNRWHFQGATCAGELYLSHDRRHICSVRMFDCQGLLVDASRDSCMNRIAIVTSFSLIDDYITVQKSIERATDRAAIVRHKKLITCIEFVFERLQALKLCESNDVHCLNTIEAFGDLSGAIFAETGSRYMYRQKGKWPFLRRYVRGSRSAALQQRSALRAE
jgi:hypothetical protein